MIAIGCDHGALELKEQLIEHLKREALSVRIMAHIQRIHVIILYMQRKWLRLFFLVSVRKEFFFVEQELE